MLIISIVYIKLKCITFIHYALITPLNVLWYELWKIELVNISIRSN